MIATFTLCSRRAFSDVLEGMALKNFLGASPQTPSFFCSSSTVVKYCNSEAYTPPVQLSLRALLLVLPWCIGKSENALSVVNSKWDKYLFGINQMRIVGKDDDISYIYCHSVII